MENEIGLLIEGEGEAKAQFAWKVDLRLFSAALVSVPAYGQLVV
ncbi:predicted protein [Sclerotinia sclerotiorum 1980 UF-70]|uniref:Uncharacterized protein n=1 Tax=Sclerotinia sclerotiorum (strain ATCC 18683 / 1980 / Ss-1) TaxID=665079 RepID=A7EII9_SCLS1|nr:predicted protein [Sclerotinia sclerotiorum 1980 UF-70]EDO02655.1 predicted protein [Sclerotinia sclerotiorum 1980 UF-70]